LSHYFPGAPHILEVCDLALERPCNFVILLLEGVLLLARCPSPSTPAPRVPVVDVTRASIVAIHLSRFPLIPNFVRSLVADRSPPPFPFGALSKARLLRCDVSVLKKNLEPPGRMLHGEQTLSTLPLNQASWNLGGGNRLLFVCFSGSGHPQGKAWLCDREAVNRAISRITPCDSFAGLWRPTR
jgi:hypothetical protein